jgi:hypothetical protein
MHSDYFLPEHVYFCGRGEAAVFLDLRNDEYTMVQGVQTLALKACIATQCDRPKRIRSENDPPLQAALDEMVEAGLLTTDSRDGRPIAPTDIVAAGSVLVETEAAQDVRVTPLDLWRFAASCTSAALKLRSQPIEKTVQTVRGRKAARAGELDWQQARKRVCVFNRLRSLFPADYLCLFDSLALVDFLARYDVFPTWVFAVQFEPWAAHCWVQEGDALFNESPEEAAEYVPIMAI